MEAEELLERYAKGERNFSSAKLNGIDLRGAELSEIDLSNADLSDANFKGSELSKANLTNAKINKADFRMTSLKGANLSGAQGGGEYMRHGVFGQADLSCADLSDAQLIQANLCYVDLSNANLNNANLANVDLSRANLSGASLVEATLDRSKLSGVNFTKANLAKADLSRSDLSGVTFKEVNLQGAKLLLVNLNGFDLSGLNLAYTNLTGAKLEQATLRNCCLKGANLERASLHKADLMRAILKGANLKRADLTETKTYAANFEDADFTGALMPDGEIYKPGDFEVESPKQKVSLKQVTSMTRQIIRTDAAPAPVGPYNQAIVASGQMVFVAGQIAIDPRVGHVVYTDDVAKQTECVMSNLEAILKAAGANWSNVVKTTVFLSDMNNFAAMNAVYAKYFDEANAPARATVEVSRLPKDVLVEIDCIAVI